MTLFKKCIGCGATLNSNKGKIGYIEKYDPQKQQYCQRCFKLINYNQNTKIDNISTTINEVINEIKLEKHMVYLVVDALDLLSMNIKEINNISNLIIIVNKIDLFSSFKDEKIIKEKMIKNINSINKNYQEIIFTSINNKNSIKDLYSNLLKYYKQKYKLIFIGKSNSGKSSLINALLKMNKLKPILTTSSFLDTTCFFNKIKINKISLIDTPGFNNNLSYLYLLKNERDNNKIILQKIKHLRNYQIRQRKTLKIENLFYLDVKNSETKIGTIKLLINDNLKITSHKFGYYKNEEELISFSNHEVLNKIEFNLNGDNVNIVISSFGIIACKNIDEINFRASDTKGIYQLKYPII